MRQLFRLLHVLVLGSMLGLLVGCSSSFAPPQTYTYEKERVYAKPHSEVWQKVTEWLVSQNITIKKSSDSLGTVVAGHKLTKEDFNPESTRYLCDCGKPGGSMTTSEKVKYASSVIDIAVTTVDRTSTKVIVMVAYKAELYTNEFGSESLGDSFLRALDCNSTGRLEKELLDFVGR